MEAGGLSNAFQQRQMDPEGKQEHTGYFHKMITEFEFDEFEIQVAAQEEIS